VDSCRGAYLNKIVEPAPPFQLNPGIWQIQNPKWPPYLRAIECWLALCLDGLFDFDINIAVPNKIGAFPKPFSCRRRVWGEGCPGSAMFKG